MAALHGLLLLAWWLRPAPPVDAWPLPAPPAPGQAAEPIVWLLWPGRPAATGPDDTPAPTPSARQAPAPTAPPAPRREPLTGPVRDPLAITLPAAASVAPAAADAPAVASPAQAAASTPATPDGSTPLNLNLPRRSPGSTAAPPNPALQADHGRDNSIEARLERLLGQHGGPLIQERLADGSLRLRRGADCVIVRPNRNATLDPFNQAVSPSPRQADSC